MALRVIRQNPIWPPEPWYGHPNIFSMGDKSKILFPIIGFSYPSNSKKYFCHPGGSQWAPGGLLARFRENNAYFGTNLQKNQNFLAF